MFSRKADDQQVLDEEISQRNKEWCTIGSFVNYSMIILFFAVFLSCIIVIGSLGTLQSDLSKAQGGNRSCYMYATFSGDEGDCTDKFNTVATHPCDGSMVAFSFVAAISIAFMISLFIKAFLHHNLNWTLFIEIPVIIGFTAIVFGLCVMISIGNVATCNSIKKYDKDCKDHIGKNCSIPFPSSSGHNEFYHQTRANLAQNTAWFVFLFLIIALVLYIIRLVVFLKRRRKQNIQQTLEREDFHEESQSDPKAI